jgi:hypothetical protein
MPAELIATRYDAKCSLYGSAVAKGEKIWYDKEADRGKRVVCTGCQSSGEAAPEDQSKADVNPVGGTSALAMDKTHRGSKYLKGAVPPCDYGVVLSSPRHARNARTPALLGSTKTPRNHTGPR